MVQAPTTECDYAAEERAASVLVREARRARDARGGTTVPAWLTAAILAGEHPLRAARRRAGLTQAQLAAAAGIGQSHVSDVEAGRKSLGPAALAAVARHLDLDPDWITD